MSRRAWQARRIAKAEARSEAENERPRPPKKRRLDPDRDPVKMKATAILSQRFSKNRGITTTVTNEEMKKKLTPGLPLEDPRARELMRFRERTRKVLRGK